ncbi:MAG: S8 family serine peptidase [bacterium]
MSKNYFISISLLFFIITRGVFAFLPNDPDFSEQWNLVWTKASQGWDLEKGSEEVVIAILDSGVDLDHPDLKDNIWQNPDEIPGDGIDNDHNGYIDDLNGWDFINDLADPQPKFSTSYSLAGINHGTIVAGIAAASGNNGQGITGVAWKVKIMSLRVLNSQGMGDNLSVIKAIDYAIQEKADVINMSFVGTEYSKELEQAIKRAWEKGIVVVAAGGNDTIQEGVDLSKISAYPVCYENVIGVAALDKNNKKALFSNYGRCIDISAPGTGIYSTLVYHPEDKDFTKYYGGYWSGTSLAAPLVAGTAALIKSVNPQLTNGKIRDIILSQVSNIEAANPELAGQLGKGRLNIYQAVRKVYLDLTAYSGKGNIVTGAGFGGGPQIRIFKTNGLDLASFFAYDPHFRGGVNVAVGDLDGDGNEEIVTGAGSGGGPHVRVFDSKGNFKFHFFAYDQRFRGGVNVTVGDLNGDGKDEIITGAGFGGGPQVRIFGVSGQPGDPSSSLAPLGTMTLKCQFFAYAKNFRGGVNVAVGDLNGDGKDEIITGAGFGGGPQVRIFDNQGRVRGQFFAYAKNFRGGVSVSTGDLNGDGKDEIITGAGFGGGPQVRIFDADGQVQSQFFAYTKSFRGGVDVATIRSY